MMIMIANAIGLATSLRGGQHRRGSVHRSAVLASLGHDAKRVLDHHHRAIDHHADADRQAGQRHQVGRQARTAPCR
jgi:hypothetical protein